MKRENNMTSFVDLMAILLIVFMMITVLLVIQMAQKNNLLSVELSSTESRSPSGNEGGETKLYLSVNAEKKMVLEGNMIDKDLEVNTMAELEAALKSLHPTKLFLRIDNSIPTEITVQLLLSCQNNGILPFLTTLEKKGA